MKKENVEKKEKKVVENTNKNQAIKVVIGVVVAIVAVVGLFFASELSGDRSNDKKALSASTSGAGVGSSNSGEEENPLIENGESWTGDEVAELKEINLSDLKDLVKGKEVTVVMLGTETCYWCINQKPVLAHALYLYPEVSAVYMDVSKLDRDGQEYLASLDSELESFGTPTFIAVKGGKVTKVDTNGARSVKSLKTMFENMGAM